MKIQTVAKSQTYMSLTLFVLIALEDFLIQNSHVETPFNLQNYVKISVFNKVRKAKNVCLLFSQPD